MVFQLPTSTGDRRISEPFTAGQRRFEIVKLQKISRRFRWGFRMDSERIRCVEWIKLDYIELYSSGQIITTSAEVTLNGGLIRELPQNPLNSGLGINYTNLPR